MLLLHQAYANSMLTLQFLNLNSAKSRICACTSKADGPSKQLSLTSGLVVRYNCRFEETSCLVGQVNCCNYLGRDLASTSAAFSEISDLNLDHTTLELIATCPSISFVRRVTVYPANRKESLGRRLCFERRIQQTEFILASILGDVHKLTICMRH